jgi:hypothetical protein
MSDNRRSDNRESTVYRPNTYRSVHFMYHVLYILYLTILFQFQELYMIAYMIMARKQVKDLEGGHSLFQGTITGIRMDRLRKKPRENSIRRVSNAPF